MPNFTLLLYVTTKLCCFQSKPGEVEEAVKHAIDVGYRQFDCARFYENEAEIGKAIREKIQEGVVKREDLFITSKLWCTNMRPDLVEPTLKSSLADLGLEYLDLYLIHWPCAFKEDTNNPGKVLFSDVDYVDTWKAMEDVHKKGLAKSVGISNFNERQVTRLLENAKVVPVVNQVQIVVRYAVYYKKNGLSSKRVTSGDFKKTKNNRSKGRGAEIEGLVTQPIRFCFIRSKWMGIENTEVNIYAYHIWIRV
ncbi:unnamed protein product [Acanthoscelides obtectus]|uniref:NADP-dependent oxidoreductase domain-containing protein n=1 Tax=Acanthoscelides obtectus TaxID=200917 RepID=A0A9P0JPA3_ACAOB|nr:unnamed protein product [Acanthoscelides obtectus]CAK1642851.1 1,5-anhydro-D-fructose reductase [Acanthoscelides obtectus]